MNNWLSENMDQINYYVSSKDAILVGRKNQIRIMVDLFNSYFDVKNELNILDLGCGDGVLSKILFELYPDNSFNLLDGSKTMIEKAKQTMNTDKAFFINDSFDNFTKMESNENQYDFIFSSMAIHHVEHHKKLELHSKCYSFLKQKGLFVNIDVVLPVSSKTERFQFKMWTDYINDHLRTANREKEIGKHDLLPMTYKGNYENKPSTLESQLKMLNDIGFKDVECYYKHGIFVLIAGVKQ